MILAAGLGIANIVGVIWLELLPDVSPNTDFYAYLPICIPNLCFSFGLRAFASHYPHYSVYDHSGTQCRN